MNVEFIDELIMPTIMVASLCIGFIMKKWLPTDDRIIPTVLGIFGIISGFIVFGFTYDGFVRGLFSGLAAVGAHQLVHQRTKSLMGEDELYSMGPEWLIEEEEYEEAYEEEVRDDE